MPNAIMIALGKAHPKSDEPSEADLSHHDDEDIEVDGDEMAAAKAAYEAKDAEEYCKALKAFFHLCMMKHEGDEEAMEASKAEEESY